jgi:hypothetical protein
MSDQRTFRFIIIFMVGFSIAYLLNLLLNTQRANETFQNVVSYALAPIVTVAIVIGYSMWRKQSE